MADPQGLLAEIVARKRTDVAARFGAASFVDIAGDAAPSCQSLAAALTRPGARFIMEVKRSSPSGGAIRADADPETLAAGWRGVADAISVLTDSPYFGGSLEDLASVRASWEGPILAKDFMVDPRQVAEARRHGADAILVMLSVLDDGQAAEMIAAASRLGMEALVETHDEVEIRRAVAHGARLIGINNRDLRTLEVDLATTERLAGLVPRDRLLVSESGITRRGDVERQAPLVDAFLVGSSLMRAPDPVLAARQLAFGRVKVCGLTEIDDVRAAALSGAAFGGLILVPGSPRCVDLAKARLLAGEARRASLAPVAVFRNLPFEQAVESIEALEPEVIQLHGCEDPNYIQALRERLSKPVEIWAVAGVARQVDPCRPKADRTIFDSQVAGQTGGTGASFDWSRVARRHDLPRAVLAGGIAPDNARAAAQVGAWAIDVGSGVESAPGRKDPDRLAALFEALRPPARGEVVTCA